MNNTRALLRRYYSDPVCDYLTWDVARAFSLDGWRRERKRNIMASTSLSIVLKASGRRIPNLDSPLGTRSYYLIKTQVSTASPATALPITYSIYALLCVMCIVCSFPVGSW